MASNVMFSEAGSTALSDWQTASTAGGRSVRADLPTFPSCYNVDVWICVDDHQPENVSGAWLSSMDGKIRTAFLKELNLPVKKDLVYKDTSGVAARVIDISIACAWEGCYSLLIKLEDSTTLGLPVNSAYFSEMNVGKTDIASPSMLSNVAKMMMPDRFVMFDLETTGTNPNTAEICEIGAIRVLNNEQDCTFESLVYIDNDMPDDAFAVHHISNDDLEDACHATAAIEGFLRFVGGDSIIVGHNIKTYDIPLIKRVAKLCGHSFQYAYCIDTLDVAKRAWPNLGCHQMDYLRILLGIDGKAHRALKDCYDEWTVYEAAISAIQTGEPTLEDDPNILSYFVSSKQRSNTRSTNGNQEMRSRSKRAKAASFTPTTVNPNPSHPLYLKNVVISGDLDDTDKIGSYNSAMQEICDLGGIPQDNVTMKTNFLVVGHNPGRKKLAIAERYRDSKGLPIEIIDIDKLNQLLCWSPDSIDR